LKLSKLEQRLRGAGRGRTLDGKYRRDNCRSRSSGYARTPAAPADTAYQVRQGSCAQRLRQPQAGFAETLPKPMPSYCDEPHKCPCQPVALDAVLGAHARIAFAKGYTERFMYLLQSAPILALADFLLSLVMPLVMTTHSLQEIA
jgi:hypothetical protein